MQLKILASHPIQYHAPVFRALAAAGHAIEVGYFHKGMAGQPALDAEFGIEIQWDVDLLAGYPHRFFLPGPADYRPASQLQAARRMLPWALRDRRTPLLLVSWFTEAVWLVWLLRVLAGAPTLVLCTTTPRSYAATPKPAWRTALLRWLLRRTAAGLFIGRRNREFLTGMGLPAARLFPAPYSVDNRRLAEEADRLACARADLCRRFALDPQRPTFLFCGKFTPNKRLLNLLDAFLAAGLDAKAQLLLVGEGAQRAAIERRVAAAGAQHVRLAGFLNQSQMPTAYVLGHLLCLISETETWGLVVNEALASGRPVIVADTVGCAPDLVGPENGWVVPLDDAPALEQALRAAYDRRAEWPAMGSHGRQRVSGHTYQAMAAGIAAAAGAAMQKRMEIA